MIKRSLTYYLSLKVTSNGPTINVGYICLQAGLMLLKHFLFMVHGNNVIISYKETDTKCTPYV